VMLNFACFIFNHALDIVMKYIIFFIAAFFLECGHFQIPYKTHMNIFFLDFFSSGPVTFLPFI
jgi:hypothetical protein